MAAIVSQLAAANRRRKANKKNNIPIEKSVYVLPPFDPCFKPEVHNRYMRHKQAHLAHQEFIARVGAVSPVHIVQLEQLGTQRMKSRRNGNTIQPLDDDDHSEPPSPDEEPPKEPPEAVDEDDDVEMRLLEDREMVKSEKSDEESEDTPRSIKCQLIIAFLGILALIPMVGIVVYLVGMFYDVPDTTKS